MVSNAAPGRTHPATAFTTASNTVSNATTGHTVPATATASSQ
jgi:hypothetical protein